MKRSVLASVALAMATGYAGQTALGAAADPPPAAQPHHPVAAHLFATGTSPALLLAIPAPPPPVPQAPDEHTPIPQAPASKEMVAQAEPAQQPVQAPVATSAGEASLDVDALKTRLRDTDAIGLFTKIALKNQVDDLLEQFRAQHIDGQSNGVAALREPYDLLVLKVLALIQDADPTLARTVAASREAIWAILADREKFKSAI